MLFPLYPCCEPPLLHYHRFPFRKDVAHNFPCSTAWKPLICWRGSFSTVCIYEPLIPTWWSIKRGIKPWGGHPQQSELMVFAGSPLIVHRRLQKDLHVFDSAIPKRSKSKRFLSRSRCLRSCCSRCCSPGRFRDRGLVVAAKSKNTQKPQETLRRTFGRIWFARVEWGEQKPRKREGESGFHRQEKEVCENDYHKIESMLYSTFLSWKTALLQYHRFPVEEVGSVNY